MLWIILGFGKMEVFLMILISTKVFEGSLQTVEFGLFVMRHSSKYF